MTFDPWAFDTGVFVDDYNGVIEAIEFAPGKFNFQGAVNIRLDEPVARNDGSLKTHHPHFVTVGGLDQWEAMDHGRSFRHTSGEDFGKNGLLKLRAQSGWAQFCQRVRELVPELAGDPRQAATFEGLHLHWVTEGAGVPYEFKDRETGEVRKGLSKGSLMPVEVLDGKAVGTAASFDLSTLTDAHLTILRPLAEVASNFGNFQNKALTWALDQPEKDVLVAAISEPGLYAALTA